MNKPSKNPVNDDDLLEAYKAFRQLVATTTHVFGDYDELITWFVAEVNTANLTWEVTTVLFRELFEAGAITRVHGGYAFSRIHLEEARFAEIVAIEREQHLASLNWDREIVRRRFIS